VTTDPKQETTTRSRPISSARSSNSLLAAAPHEQIATALADEHITRAVELLLQHGERMLVDGAADALQGWLAALPSSHLQQSHRLALLASWVAIYQQRFRDAATHLAQAERALQTKMIAYDAGTRVGSDFLTRPFAESQQGIDAVKAHLRAVNGEETDAHASVDAMMLAASSDHPIWRAEALVVLGRCRFLSGDAVAAGRDLEDALALASTSGSARARRAEGEALVLLGHLAAYSGRPAQAAAHFAAVSDKAGSAAAAARVGQAKLALDALDMKGAERLLAESGKFRAVGDAPDVPFALDPLTVTALGASTGIVGAALSGEHKAAQAQLDQLERDLKPTELRWLLELVQPLRTNLAVLNNDLPLLRRHTQQASVARGPARGLSEVRRQLALSLAHLRLDNLTLAQEYADAARVGMEGSGLDRITAEAGLYGALAAVGLDSAEAGLIRLDAALEALAEAGATLPIAFIEAAPMTNRWLAEGPSGPTRSKLEAAVQACRAELVGAAVDPATPIAVSKEVSAPSAAVAAEPDAIDVEADDESEVAEQEPAEASAELG